MASTKVILVTLMVNKIPDEYKTADFKWRELSKRRYMLTTTLGNIIRLKKDERIVVHPDVSYQLI